ncbi:MAG: Phosphonoacetaldehyde hydrolase [Planctomycetota bacterium]|jgi:phosphonoacetaldehyde hydrolase
MPHSADPLRDATAVALSWHGVLFDRDRRSIHAAVAATFARWQVQVSTDELTATRGPTGRPHVERLLSMPRIAEAFRAAHGRWAGEDDIASMTRDLEPRLAEAAEAAPQPNEDACRAIRHLHARGLRTAVICCTPRRLLGPQLAALERAGLPLDCVVTADEACEPAPAPWGIFEAVQQLGLGEAGGLVLVDDCPAGWAAARNAGVRSLALLAEGMPGGDAHATLRSLQELGGA